MAQKRDIVSNEQVALPDEDRQSASPFVMRQLGKIKDMNREFDIAFWQAQDTSTRLNAGWELVAYYLKRKGRADELRLQRTVESLQRKSG